MHQMKFIKSCISYKRQATLRKEVYVLPFLKVKVIKSICKKPYKKAPKLVLGKMFNSIFKRKSIIQVTDIVNFSSLII